MAFQTPVGSAGMVLLDPNSRVHLAAGTTVALAAGTQVVVPDPVTLAPGTTVALAAGTTVALATGTAVAITGTVALAPGTTVTAQDAPLLAATPAGWQVAQRDALNALTALLAAHSAASEAFTLAADTSPEAEQVKADLLALITAQTAILKDYTP